MIRYSGDKKGVLSDCDIMAAMSTGDIFIAPFEKSRLQPSGYNLTPTPFVYSTKKKRLMPVIERNGEKYVYIEKNDTVLVRTRERIAISEAITGSFYSKVKVVSEGFGHVSTTLDPNWEGQLLIALNNPTDKKLVFFIDRMIDGERKGNTFVTLEFSYLNTPTGQHSDNPPGRLDILERTINKKVSYWKRRQVESLRALVDELHVLEDNCVEEIVLKNLNEQERRNWDEIELSEESDEEVQEQRRKYLREMQRKYIRRIRREFEKNAEESNRLVEKYIEKKETMIPLYERIFRWIGRHKESMILLGIAAVILAVWWIAKKGLKLEGWPSYNVLIVNLIFPVIIFVLEHIKFHKE